MSPIASALARLSTLWLAAALTCAPLAARGGPTGDGIRLERAGLEALGIPSRPLRVLEPHEQRERVYEGLPATALLDALFGPAWRQAGAVRFDCADGYRALLDPAKLQAHEALLAWGTGDGEAFALVNRLQGDERVELGPFYLVWDNRESPELLAAGASDWPYQMVGLALVDVATHLPRTLPPADAEPAAQRGFVAFRQHCLMCHRINGQGGDKAPELNLPASVTEYLAEGWLRRWMLEPASVRLGTSMPPLAPQDPQREALASDIEAYLRAMAAHKQWPESH